MKIAQKEKTIACICHGAQLLISAKVTEGRDISGYYSIKDDIVNSGANYVDEPVVVSKNIVIITKNRRLIVVNRGKMKLRTG